MGTAYIGFCSSAFPAACRPPTMGDRKKTVTVLDMSKYMDSEIRVKFMGGREVVGVLKGYDALLNLVLDETNEFLKAPDDPYKLLDETRPLGLTVCRGTSIVLVCPTDGLAEIENPFLQEGGEDEDAPADDAPADEAS